jgi:tetrahydromethanopterin S-methyltransferase subunit B
MSPDNSSSSKPKLNVRVSESKKQEWKDSLADGETLTSLVRRAVDREINDDYVPKDALNVAVDTSNQIDIDLSSLTTQLDELQRTVEAFENKLDTASASNNQIEEDIESLAMDLLSRLPAYPQDISEEKLKEYGGLGDRDPQEYIRHIVPASQEDESFHEIDGTAQRFARELQSATPIIREALIHLEKDTTENVASAVVDGHRHWMRYL